MTIEFNIRKTAEKFILKQDAKQRDRILKAIYALPYFGEIKKMAGSDRLYRLRVGDYRIFYEISSIKVTVILVEVIDADNRGQIYK